MQEKLKSLNKETLEQIILEMQELLSEKQKRSLKKIISEYVKKKSTHILTIPVCMSQALVDEKMEQIRQWMEQIDQGELFLETEDEYEYYEDYHWNSDYEIVYIDTQEIADKIMEMINFARDCVSDRRYQEAHFIYEWLWQMVVIVDSEYDSDELDLGELNSRNIICTDIKAVALLTLYVDYQVLPPQERAEDIYLYFGLYSFKELHVEDMFRMGLEELSGTEQFWKDWIDLLETEQGDTERRLLTEAILYTEGNEGLIKRAAQNSKIHPGLYLAALEACNKNHDYERMEKLGFSALEKVNKNLIIRREILLKAAYASSCLNHTKEMALFCWESFCSDCTVKNFLRLFGTKEMAALYGNRGKEILRNRNDENVGTYIRNQELGSNTISSTTYYTLSFLMGDFEKVKKVCEKPKDSFMYCGMRLFLLYLNKNLLPSTATVALSLSVGFPDEENQIYLMDFERQIAKEAKEANTSIFWNYFQKWKTYFPMDEDKQISYLAWVEKMVYENVDEIVSSQNRAYYGEVAMLLANVGEIKESMGIVDAKSGIYAEYKKKFPRHTAFQKEMRTYFLSCYYSLRS